MDQSESNNKGSKAPAAPQLPKRGFSVEFAVGLFTMASVAAGGYLAVGLGGLTLMESNTYMLQAEFDNISGLKYGASVEIGGVPIGEVTNITLKDPQALITMKIDRSVQIRDDDIFSIRTKGIIGDRYVKVSRGGSNEHVPEGGVVRETESVVDLEDLIGKFVHNFESDSKE